MIELASRLPWWLSLILALASYLFLHAYATSPIPRVTDPHQMAAQMTSTLFHSLAMGGQYLLPLAFVFGSIGSVFTRLHRRRLLANVSSAINPGRIIDGISWREFELLIGEVFRQKGYVVSELGGAGPDGGVDIVLHKDGEKYLVQCKHWRSLKVGVSVVRELFGVMAAQGAVGGFVVTSGKMTSEAKSFSAGLNIVLVEGDELRLWLASVGNQRSEPGGAKAEAGHGMEDAKCPNCQSSMVLRTAKRGLNIGNRFWGCSKYPLCKGIRNI
nr:restriction endonuclease [Pseudomonas sp. J452]